MHTKTTPKSAQIIPLFPDRHTLEYCTKSAPTLSPDAVDAYLKAHNLKAVVVMRDDLPLRKVLDVMGAM